eukprot:jgi/Tetstr1/435879/TSEL_024767.t1
MQDRLAFAREWVSKSWDNAVVTDSKYFWLCTKGPGFKEWVLFEDEPPTKPSEKNCFKLHVYGGVSKYGRTPLFVTAGSTRIKRGKGESKEVTGAVYLDLLKRELIPACKELMSRRPAYEQNKPWVFQRDSAKPHTTKIVKRWLADQEGFNTMKWPAKSPDLSWIQNMWAIVSSRVQRRANLNMDNFEQAIHEEWASIPQSA